MNNPNISQKDYELAQKIAKAKIRLLSEHPFFGLLCSKLQFAITPDCKTACTDGETIFFGEEFSYGLNSDELTFVMMHELMHIVQGHCFFPPILDSFLHNVAADIVVNSIILDELGVPELDIAGCEIMHYAPDGKEGRIYTVDQVYDMLVEMYPVETPKTGDFQISGLLGSGENGNSDNEKGNNDIDGDGNGKDNDGNGDDNDDNGEDNDDNGNASLNGKSKKSKKKNKDSENAQDEFEDKFFDDHSKWGTLGNPTYNKITMQETVFEIVEQLKRTGDYGSIPLMADRIVEDVKNPPVDWRAILNEFIQTEVTDYSFSPPDKRFSDGDFLLPDFNDTSEKIENVFIAVDTSGSISNKELSLAINEIKGAMEQFEDRFKGWISYFDEDVSEPEPFENYSDVKKIPILGFGGTSFTAVFEKAKERFKGDLSCIIVITDGVSKYPDISETLDVPVLWVMNNTSVTPPWGKVVVMNNVK